MQLFITFASAAQSRLTLFQETGSQLVTLPFEYRHLSSEDLVRTTWIPERLYCVISQDSDRLLLVGILKPYLLVALKNSANGRIIVFHKHYANSTENLLEIAERELDLTSAEDLCGIIFTNKPEPYLEKEFQSVCLGKSLFDQVKELKDKLINRFKVSNRKQIAAHIFKSATRDLELGDYEFAELSVLIDAHFKPYSVCMMHEDVFCIKDQFVDRVHGVQLFSQIERAMRRSVIQKYFHATIESLIWDYEAAPFARIP